MPLGPGKYDDQCTRIREELEAEGAILVVFNGKDGNGMSMQASPELIFQLPATLRGVADDIEKSFRSGII